MTCQPLEIGFIGLATMGAPVATHVVAAGRPETLRAGAGSAERRNRPNGRSSGAA